MATQNVTPDTITVVPMSLWESLCCKSFHVKLSDGRIMDRRTLPPEIFDGGYAGGPFGLVVRNEPVSLKQLLLGKPRLPENRLPMTEALLGSRREHPATRLGSTESSARVRNAHEEV